MTRRLPEVAQRERVREVLAEGASLDVAARRAGVDLATAERLAAATVVPENARQALELGAGTPKRCRCLPPPPVPGECVRCGRQYAPDRGDVGARASERAAGAQSATDRDREAVR
jgi:hypothetical protein